MTKKSKQHVDSVAMFRAIKERLATQMEGMSLFEKKTFLKNIREGKVKLG